jgi:hypothetical protein
VYVERRPGELALGPEASAAFWFPLEDAARGDFDSELTFERGGAALRFPSWRYEAFEVWGMTRRMLQGLLDRLRVEAPHSRARREA